MKTLLTVIALHAGNAPLAESLCDWIFALNGKKPFAHALLVVSEDVHAEMKMKTTIAAEMAFDTVTVTVAPVIQNGNQPQRNNLLFAHASRFVKDHFRTPFIYLDAGSVPLKKPWLKDLSSAYSDQPKRFLGNRLKIVTSSNKEVIFLPSISVYPPDASEDLEPYFMLPVPFEHEAGKITLPRSTKTTLIQHMQFTGDGDATKIRKDAVLLASDPTGQLISLLRNESETAGRK